MAKKKPVAKKKTAARKKPAVKKAARKTAATSRRKSVASKKPAVKTRAAIKKRAKKSAAPDKIRSLAPSTLEGQVFEEEPKRPRRGAGSTAAGQSGDSQGLSRREETGSESVEQLAEEGQYFEADLVDAIENAPDPDQGELHPRQVPVDDVPSEYTDEE